MDSPLSPVLENLCMQKFKEVGLDIASAVLKVWLHYIDNVFAIQHHAVDKLYSWTISTNSTAKECTIELVKHHKKLKLRIVGTERQEMPKTEN